MPNFTLIPIDQNGHEVQSPLAQYDLVRWTDDTASPVYLGYLHTNGAWYIKKVDTTARTSTYVSGGSAFSTSWAGHTGLTYVEFNEAL